MIHFIRFITVTSIFLLFCSVTNVLADSNAMHEENEPVEIQENRWNLVYLVDNNTLDSIEYPQGFEKIWIRFTSDSVYVHGFCPTVGTEYKTYPNDSIQIGSIPILESCGEPYFSPDWNREVAANLTKSFMYNVNNDWLTIYTNGRYNLVFALPHVPTALVNKDWNIVYFIENKTSDTIRYSDDLKNIRVNFTSDSVFIHGFCPVAGSGYRLFDNDSIHIDSIPVSESCDVPYDAPPQWDHDLALDLPNTVHYKSVNEWLIIHTTGTYSFLFTFSETTRAITNKPWILDAFIEQSGDTILYPDGEKKIKLTIGIDSVFIHGLCSTEGAPFVRQNFDIVYIEPISTDKTCGISAELLQWNEDLANDLLGFNLLEMNEDQWLTISSGAYISVYKSSEAVGIHTRVAGKPKIKLYQNEPNPFLGETGIRLFIPEYIENATLHISSIQGAYVQSVPVYERGEVKINFASAGMQPGIYFCSLVIDGIVSESIRMFVLSGL